jgi:hypothetical protein
MEYAGRSVLAQGNKEGNRRLFGLYYYVYAIFLIMLMLLPPLCPPRRTAHYQVRQYKPFWVAETALDFVPEQQQQQQQAAQGQQQQQSGVSPASVGIKAFRALVGYLSGQNEAKRSIAMTTPVFTTSEGAMQFVVGASGMQVRMEDN